MIEENEELKSQLDEMEKEINDLKVQVTYAKSNPTYMFDDDDDDFKIDMQFQEDEIRIDKKNLTRKKSATSVGIMETKSPNKSVISDLNQAFIDKSRIDTSNMLGDDGSVLGGQLNKSNISTNECSRCKRLIHENRKQAEIIKEFHKQSKEKQNLFDSFGVEMKKQEEPHLNINEDLVISGNHIKKPNTFELSKEISELEKSIGRITHNRTMSNIKYPSCHKRMESEIKLKEVFGHDQ